MSATLRPFSQDFQQAVKSRGREYFGRRAVKIVQAEPGLITARVHGSEWYDVRIEYDPGSPDPSTAYECTCPYFADHDDPCKHLWATLLQAEAEGLLPEPRYVPVEEAGRGPSATGAGDEDDGEEDDEDDNLELGVTGMVNGKPVIALNNFRKLRGVTDPSGGNNPKDKAGAWKRQLEALKQSMRQADAPRGGSLAASTPWPPGKRILYVVDVQATLEGAGLTIELISQTLKKDGTPDKPKQLKIGRDQVTLLPDPADRQILQMLLGAHRGDWGYYSYYDSETSRRFVLPEAAFDTTFRLICQTGRCRLRPPHGNDADLQHVAWDDGPPWEFWLEVKPSPGGRYYVLDGHLRRGEGESQSRVAIADPHLFVRGGLVFLDGRVARLEHFGAFDLIIALRDGMKLSVPLDQQDEMLRVLLSLPQLPKLDLPEDLKLEEARPAPRPRLTVKKPPKSTHDDRLIAYLSFDYGGQIVDFGQEAQAVLAPEGRRVVYRNPGAEAVALGRLLQAGFREAYDYYSAATKDGRSLRLPVAKLPKVVNELAAEGWHVEAEGKLYRQPGEFKVQVRSGIDWFELHGSVSFGDNLTAALPRLLAALRRGERTVVLDDGSLGMLPDEWLKRYATLAALGEEDAEHLKFTKRQVGFLDALLSQLPEASFDETYSRARDELMRFEGVRPLEAPETFTGQLRPYQRDGLGWMQFLRTFGFGGCLADDMGLGKTVQILALIEDRRKLRTVAVADGNGKAASNGDATSQPSGHPATPAPAGPSLVVVPRSLVFNWVEEAKRFTPQMRVLDHTHAQRRKESEHFNEYDIVLTTYGTLRRDAGYFKDVNFDYVVLDEAQAVKNAASESAKAVRLLRADHRLALSGTPVQNHLGELWSLFEFLNPGMMGAASIFKSIGAGSANVAPEARQMLAKALRPFILRRTKEQVAKDLPAKLEQTLVCEMEAEQRKLYDELRDHYRQSLLERVAREGMNKAKIEVLEALLRLRQAACHPGLIDKKRSGEGSAKLDELLERVGQVLEENHKVLVFSQFTSLLAIVRQRFDAAGTVYEYLDGKTRDRQARVERFQNDPDCKLFLISLKAGGLGLNLTAAEYVFLLDPWWNPAVEAQAIDRAHRIGQTRQVFAYRLIAKDTVEEKVLQLQQTKKDLADAIVNADNSLIRTLGKEDLELLLS